MSHNNNAFCRRCSSFFVSYTPNSPLSRAKISVYWLRAHALGVERDIEVTISNNTFGQNNAKITFHIYNDSCLQMIEIGWWSKLESAHGLMEGVDGWQSYYFIR